MAEAVLDLGEVSINGVRYPIAGSVRRSLSSIYPGKTVIGDYTKDSSPILSTLALSDHRGGIGQDIYDGEGPANRSWYSTADTRYKGHLILPPLVTNTGGLPAGATQFGAMVEFKGELYVSIWVAAASALNGVYKYNNATDSWGSRVLAPGTPEIMYDAVVGNIGGTQYIIFAENQNYYYSTDGAAWTAVAITANYARMVVIWDDKLWLIGSSNEIVYGTAVGTIPTTNVAGKVSVKNVLDLQALIVARDATGEQIIYAVTANGLLAHDFGNSRFTQTGLHIPSKTTTTLRSLATAYQWREAIYFAAETSLFKYAIGAGQAAISVVGPDRDGGIPSGYGSLIARIYPSLNELIVSINGTGTQKGLLLGWDTQGWRVLTELAASENFSSITKTGIAGMYVSGAYGEYRVWWTSDEGDYIKYMKLPSDLVNTLQISTYTYDAAATHDWPWFTAGQSDVTKVAVRVKVETKNPTASETVILSYALDWVETYTAFATISAAGVTTFNFPNATTPTGTAFRAIRFRAEFARGGTNTNTPDLLSVTLEYYKKMDPKWQFQVAVDMNNGYKGNTPKQLRAAMLTAQETATMVEFTYRDPALNTDATFYVQVRPVEGAELTGVDERGVSQLLLVEV